MVFFYIIIMILAVLQVIFPREAFMFGKRWQFKEGAEPSDVSVFMTRLSGIVIIVVILFLMFSTR